MSRTSMITVEAKPFMKIVSKIVSTPHSINSLPPRRFDSSQVVSLSMLHVVLMPTNLLRLHFGIMLPITITRSPIRQFATTLMSTLIFSCPSDMLISINKNTVYITVNIIRSQKWRCRSFLRNIFRLNPFFVTVCLSRSFFKHLHKDNPEHIECHNNAGK